MSSSSQIDKTEGSCLLNMRKDSTKFLSNLESIRRPSQLLAVAHSGQSMPNASCDLATQQSAGWLVEVLTGVSS